MVHVPRIFAQIDGVNQHGCTDNEDVACKSLGDFLMTEWSGYVDYKYFPQVWMRDYQGMTYTSIVQDFYPT